MRHRLDDGSGNTTICYHRRRVRAILILLLRRGELLGRRIPSHVRHDIPRLDLSPELGRAAKRGLAAGLQVGHIVVGRYIVPGICRMDRIHPYRRDGPRQLRQVVPAHLDLILLHFLSSVRVSE